MRGRALRVMALGTILLCLLLNPVYAQEKVKVTLWSIGDENGTYAAVFNKLIPKIEEQLPHIDIEVEYNSNEEKFTVALAGGVAPDIIILATRSAGKFVEAGLLAPIDREVFGVETDEELRGLFYGGAIGSMWMSDDVYFMPTEVTTLGTFVNLDLLAEAGLEPAVPKTWEGLLAYAKRAMRKDAEGNVQIAGLHLNRHYIWPSLYWVAMVRQAGTDWIVDGQPQFSHPGAVDHIEFYQSLHSGEGVTKPGISNADFYRGEAAIYVGGQYELAHMFNPERVQYSWTTGGFPHFEGKPRVSTSYAWGMYVPTASKVQREAWQVIEALTSPEHAPVWYETSSFLIPRAGDWIIEALGDDPRRLVFIEELDYARMEIAHPEAGRIINAILGAEQRLVNENQPSRSVLEELDREILTIISGN